MTGFWRPIATAPRNGTTVDLWGAKSTDAQLRPADMRARRFTDCRWRRIIEGMAGDFDSDWYEPNEMNPVRPTHWMPIPYPPVLEPEQYPATMTNAELILMLMKLPGNLEVIISSQGETVQIPLSAEVEAVCEEDKRGNAKDIVRLYTDNGERD